MDCTIKSPYFNVSSVWELCNKSALVNDFNIREG